MKKYFVTIPIILQMEIELEAENEEDAKIKAYEMTEIKHINYETLDKPWYEKNENGTIFEDEELNKLKQGYQVYDYNEEFG